MHQYRNPVIRGYNPDPSLCRVGDDFYLVTSSFEFFPGVPVYHSRNLVDWELINYCLTRESQLKLNPSRNSGGIYAPTIRWHDGVFYMITTNVTDKGNFIVHTKDILGEWSEPFWVDQGGIDPSLLFDDDGKVYFCSTCVLNGKQGIGLSQVNPLTGERLTETVLIHYGSGGKFPEAPHLYKHEGWYYLMMAEGGTEYGHMETIFRSREPYGSYEPCPRNPILSHRDYMGSPIQATGHGDLVEDQNGNWWLVCLGIRPLGWALLHNLGRETFLAPVTWDSNGWPVVGDDGHLELKMEASLPAAPACCTTLVFSDEFDGDTLKLDWNFVRNPKVENYSLTDRKGCLKLIAGDESLDDLNPTFLGVRQQDFSLCVQAGFCSPLDGNEPKVGLAAYYNNNYHYEIYITQEGGTYYVELGKSVHDIHIVANRVSIDYEGKIDFRIDTGKEEYIFYYRLEEEWVRAGTGKTAGLCTEGTLQMTFTGNYLGLFASHTTAYVEYFSITELS